jgi:Domain of unknown function (DUF4340)
MNRTSFSILGGVTAVLVAAAIYAIASQPSLTTFPRDRERAFPGLAAKLNDVDKIALVSNKAKFTIVKSDKGWGIAEKSGYPVAFDKVKSALVGLAELKLLESKTSDSARYPRLELENPDSVEAKSKRVELRAGDQVLAAGIIGKRNPNLFGEGGGGTYLRRGDNPQAWLAEGEITLGAAPNDWLIRDIVNVLEEDVRHAVIRQPDGAELVIHRAERKQKDLKVDNVPGDRKLKQSDANGLAGGLWRLTFEDVKPAAEVPFAGKFNSATYDTFDGLRIHVEMGPVLGLDRRLADRRGQERGNREACEGDQRPHDWLDLRAFRRRGRAADDEDGRSS